MSTDAVRGGQIIDIRTCGVEGQYTAYWTIHPETHAERVILAWTTRDTPKIGDSLWWHADHSPGWVPKGWNTRRGFLPRCGRSYDPTTESHPTIFTAA